jgi:hypothetical protein
MKIKAALLIGAVVISVGIFKTMPNRNVRNNNPLNVRHNPANQWQGMTGDDGEFVTFKTPQYGFRAAYKIIKKYQVDYGLNSISEIVKRWAPATENHTQGYIDYLAEKLDKWTSTAISESEMPELLFYMAEFEGAKGAFTLNQINEGIALA